MPARRSAAPVIAAVVALGLVVAVLAWAVDRRSGELVAGSATTPAPTTTTTTSASQPPPTPKPVDERAAALPASLPETYRGNSSCAPAPPTGEGVSASITCTRANSAHFRFPPPDRGTFLLLTDRAAQDAHFQALVRANRVPREDESGGCRPETRPAHYALYHRSTQGPVPGEFTTCFVADGVGQVWWVDTRTTTTGVLRSAAATTPDALDQLGYWWNSMILTGVG